VDPQLDKAVEVLQRDVIAWKRKRLQGTQKGEADKPTVPVNK
jgi:hypothetical protein